MDRFGGRCWLDWWASASTLLGSAPVAVVVVATDAGWDAHATVLSGDDDVAALCEIDPVWTLRFDDGSTIPVLVSVDGDRLTLTECTGPAHRPVVLA